MSRNLRGGARLTTLAFAILCGGCYGNEYYFEQGLKLRSDQSVDVGLGMVEDDLQFITICYSESMLGDMSRQNYRVCGSGYIMCSHQVFCPATDPRERHRYVDHYERHCLSNGMIPVGGTMSADIMRKACNGPVY